MHPFVHLCIHYFTFVSYYFRAKKGDSQETITDKKHRLQGKRKKPNTDETFFKKYPCKRFKAGNCDKGENCRYSHTQEDGLKPEDSESTTKMIVDVEQSKDSEHVDKSKTAEDCKQQKEVKPADIEKHRRSSIMEAEHSLLF